MCPAERGADDNEKSPPRSGFTFKPTSSQPVSSRSARWHTCTTIELEAGGSAAESQLRLSSSPDQSRQIRHPASTDIRCNFLCRMSFCMPVSSAMSCCVMVVDSFGSRLLASPIGTR